MTKASLIKNTFNWGWLTDSEVQTIIIMVGSMAVSRQTLVLKELRVLHLVPKANRRRQSSRQLGGGSQAHPHSDTLPKRPHLL